jgi:3-oxoacyl-[acyl-carrier protein] reductase
MELKDKIVIVTGGINGIGNALVKKLINCGAKVGVFDIDVEGFKIIENKHPNLYCIKCNVSNHHQVEDAVDKFFQEFSRIDVLVNNAGILYSAPLLSLTSDGLTKHSIDMWKKVVETDLSSVFYMTVNVVEKMILKRTKGVIVNISSVSAAGNAGQSAYSAAKAGVNALTATWAKELGMFGIRIVGIAPGYTDTKSTHIAVNESVLKEIIKKVPLRRLGREEEIASGILCAIENDFFNGKVFEINGGLVI